jgi:ABC-type nickel/cobalt efflux system permease component RcnA
MLMLTYIGLVVGARWTAWRDSLHYIDYAVAALIVVGGIWLLVRARRGRGSRRDEDGGGVGEAPGPAGSDGDDSAERPAADQPPARTPA